MSTQIPDKKTPLAPDDAARYLAEAYQRVTGKRPKTNILKLLIAQSALESGNWQIIHNYNFGNEKASSSDAFTQVYSFNDDPTDPGAHYAAFLSPEEGAEHYVRTLTKREHWRKGLETGKPLLFIEALSTPPVYFTADPAKYLATLVKLIDKYEDLAKKYGWSLLGIFTSIVVLGGIVSGGYVAYKRLVP